MATRAYTEWSRGGKIIDLADLYASLEIGEKATVMAGSGERLDAVAVPNSPRYHIARDDRAHPVLFVEVDAYPTGIPPLALENLLVEYDVASVISSKVAGRHMARMTVIRCLGTDPELHDLFLRVADSLVGALGPKPSAVTIREAISEFVTLFQRLESNAPVKPIKGLWAELLTMRQASRADVLAEAWHATLRDLWDFNAGVQRIEVKSSGTTSRQHRFNLAQVNPPKGTVVAVASLCVMPSAQGASVTELLRDLRQRLSGFSNAKSRLDRIAAESLGTAWREAYSLKFDVEKAMDSLAIYDASTVPAIPLPLPPGVSDVHFVSDLSSSAPWTADQLDHAGGLFAAVARRRTEAER